MSTKDWLEKDYYKVLGVSKDAKPEEIKKAFRKIARENHPDQHPGDKKAETKFKEASEANAILSDADKRKEYDEARSMFGGGGFGGFGGGGGGTGGFRFPRGGGSTSGTPGMEDLFRNMNSGAADGGLGDIFGNLFGQGATTSTTRRSGSRIARRGADVEGEVTIDFTQAVDGTTVSLQMVSEAACQACHGTGAKSGSVPRVCPNCQGSGMVESHNGGVFSATEPCPDCHGRGLLVEDPCDVCHGSGRARSTKTMQVRIPAGVTDGQKIRIKGKGSPGENGGEPGDLYVVVHVRPDKLFGRSGDNLTVTVPVTFSEASLGAEIEVPTLGGKPVKLRIPAGTPNGRTFRVRGRGVARQDGTKGDLLATVEVEVPGQLSDEARAALEAYTKAVGVTNPRSKLFQS